MFPEHLLHHECTTFHPQIWHILLVLVKVYEDQLSTNLQEWNGRHMTLCSNTEKGLTILSMTTLAKSMYRLFTLVLLFRNWTFRNQRAIAHSNVLLPAWVDVLEYPEWVECKSVNHVGFSARLKICGCCMQCRLRHK